MTDPIPTKKTVENDAKAVKTDVITHLENFGTWTEDELTAAYEWIKGKL